MNGMGWIFVSLTTILPNFSFISVISESETVELQPKLKLRTH